MSTFLLILGALTLCSTVLSAQDTKPTCNRCSATYIDAGEIEAYLKRVSTNANAVRDQQIRAVENGRDPLNVFRDPESNRCLTPSYGFRRANRTSDGRLDRTTAARKYSPLLSAAVARELGDAALTEPVH